MRRSKMQGLGKKQKATSWKNTGLQATVLVNETSAEHRGNSPTHVRDENSTHRYAVKPVCGTAAELKIPYPKYRCLCATKDTAEVSRIFNGI